MQQQWVRMKMELRSLNWMGTFHVMKEVSNQLENGPKRQKEDT